MNRYCHCLLFAFIRVNIHGGISPFHGGNTGSNPVGDANTRANIIKFLAINQGFCHNYAIVRTFGNPYSGGILWQLSANVVPTSGKPRS